MRYAIREAKLDLFAVAPGVWGMRDVMVNVFAINNPTENNWYLVDTGLKWSAPKIRQMAALLFGAGAKPAAIILTHGHFDHVGSLRKLLTEWDVPVYAHHLEIPYLTGGSSYPPPDPTVGGGLMSDIAFLYPRGPINIEDKVIALPQGGRIPGLADWTYIHTPGHAPGHISLFREEDKLLIAGDAFVTTKQESLVSILLQLKIMSGPPKYFTPDWLSAATSVSQLANLEPEIAASSHGRPMRGAGMRKSLHNLALEFARIAVPRQGRYVYSPALMDDTGVVHIPPPYSSSNSYKTLKLLGITAGVLLTMLMLKSSGKKKKKRAKAELKRLKNESGKELKQAKSEGANKWDKYGATLLETAHSLMSKVRHSADELGEHSSDKAAKYASKGKKELQHASKEARKAAKTVAAHGNDYAQDAKKAKDRAKDYVKETASAVRDKADDVKSTLKREAKRLEKPVVHWLDKMKFNIPDRR